MSYYLDPTYVVRVTMEDEEKEDEKMSKHQRFTAAREFFNSRKKLATFYEFVEDDIDGSAISSKKVIEVLKNLDFTTKQMDKITNFLNSIKTKDGKILKKLLEQKAKLILKHLDPIEQFQDTEYVEFLFAMMSGNKKTITSSQMLKMGKGTKATSKDFKEATFTEFVRDNQETINIVTFRKLLEEYCKKEVNTKS